MLVTNPRPTTTDYDDSRTAQAASNGQVEPGHSGILWTRQYVFSKPDETPEVGTDAKLGAQSINAIDDCEAARALHRVRSIVY